ncbi:MAG TPA: Lrp/AsnC family transcriptional regulator [Candidatus Nanoarchaeia archaeon]|nr:Lrp/AsnC family transcriptional regulator [Candidatus Nanoarchaeia archaeon]
MGVINIKKKDIDLICRLRGNSRTSLTNLSKETRMPITTIHDKLKILVKENIIKKYTTIVDLEKLGFAVKAILILKIKKGDKETFKDYAKKHSAVNNLFQINNGYDFILEVIFNNMKLMEEFRERIEDRFDIVKIEVHYIMEELKREDFKPLEIFK